MIHFNSIVILLVALAMNGELMLASNFEMPSTNDQVRQQVTWWSGKVNSDNEMAHLIGIEAPGSSSIQKQMKGDATSFLVEKSPDRQLKKRKCEKNKNGETCAPTTSPSFTPSATPTISPAPTRSSAPSAAPSVSPTNHPTNRPSVSPTKVPSNAPSGAPSMNPSTPSPTDYNFVRLKLERQDGSFWEENACQAPPPSGSTFPQAELTVFEYYLYTNQGASPDDSIRNIESILTSTMSEELMTCQYDGSLPFELFSVSSLPVDGVGRNPCPDDMKLDGLDCYPVVAGFTPTVFYRGQRRQLQEEEPLSDSLSKMQSEIIDVFAPVLQELLDSDIFVGGDVARTSYSGFLVNGEEAAASGSNNGASGPERLVDSESTRAESGSDKTFEYIVGGSVVGLAVVAFIITVMLLVRKRRQKQREDLDNPTGQILEGNSSKMKGFDTQNIQEGFPGEETYYNYNHKNIDTTVQEPESPRSDSLNVQVIATHTNDVENQEDVSNWTPYSAKTEDKSVMSAGQVSSAVSTGNATSPSFAYDAKTVDGLNYYVVNDVDTTADSTTFMGLESVVSGVSCEHDFDTCDSPTCIHCKERNFPSPLFVQADLQAIEEELGRHNRRPKKNRSYQAPDTVNL